MDRAAVKQNLLSMLAARAGVLPIKEVHTSLKDMGAKDTTRKVAVQELVKEGHLTRDGESYRLVVPTATPPPPNALHDSLEDTLQKSIALQAKKKEEKENGTPPPLPKLAEGDVDLESFTAGLGGAQEEPTKATPPPEIQAALEEAKAHTTQVQAEEQAKATVAAATPPTTTTQEDTTVKITKVKKNKGSKRLVVKVRKYIPGDGKRTSKIGCLEEFREILNEGAPVNRQKLIKHMVHKYGPKAKWSTMNYLAAAKKGKLKDCPRLGEEDEEGNMKVKGKK